MEGEFKKVTATMRGVKYVLVEISATDYEKCLKASRTGEDGKGDPDDLILVKLMLDKSLIEPNLTPSELWKKPYPVVQKLTNLVQTIHFAFTETDEEESERKAEEAKAAEDEDDEGEAKG